MENINQHNIRRYPKGNCIVFRKTREEHGNLSNMAPGFPIKIGPLFIKNSEVLYQALRYPTYPEIQKEILSIPSPIIAKRVARKYINYTRSDWDDARFAVMQFCIELKLVQNKTTFSKALFQTEDYSIVELTKKDKIWGAVDMGEYYEGINALGRLLMGIRYKLRSIGMNYTIDMPKIGDLIVLGCDLSFINPNTGQFD